MAIPSPSGRRVVTIEGFRPGEFFVAPIFYDVVSISEAGKSEVVGNLPQGTDAQWLVEYKLRLVLNSYSWQPKFSSRVWNVDIALHLSDELHVEAIRKGRDQIQALSFKSHPTGLQAFLSCADERGYWEKMRQYWAWARSATDNGDPDPGPWVSKVYPADCSTLKEP